MSDDVLTSSGALATFISEALQRCDMNRDDAQLAGEVLVRTELRGTQSHGLRRLRQLVNGLKSGEINPNPIIEVKRSSATTALLDGDGGMGHVVTTKAVTMALDKARNHDVGLVLIRNTHSFGAAGTYALMCAEAGFIGSVMTNGPIAMKATGSAGGALSSGTRAYGAPGADAPFVLDLAMTAVAGAKIISAADQGETIPEGWIVDARGFPSTDPTDFTMRGGTQIPIGNHKGYGLALFGELVTGLLTGAESAIELGPNKAGGLYRVGQVVSAVNVESFMPLEEFRGRVGTLLSAITNLPREAGVERIYFPGERAHQLEVTRRSNGLPLPSSTWESLSNVARELDLIEILNESLLGGSDVGATQ